MVDEQERRAPSWLATFKAIWTGTTTKATYLKYFFTVFAIYVVGIILGASLYPGGFSMLTVYVSYLGGNEENPVGKYPYNASVFIAGVLLIPHFIYVYKRLTPACKALSFIACLCGIAGCIGFMSLSFLNQGVGRLHIFSTDFTYGGFGASAVFILFASIRKAWLKHAWPKWWQIAVIYGQLIGLVGITLLFSESDVLSGLAIDPAFFEDKFWEWIYTFAVLGWIVETAIITPDIMPRPTG
jgi:hypothetical protein